MTKPMPMVLSQAEKPPEYHSPTREMLSALRPQGPAGTPCTDICQWCLNPFGFTMKLSGKPRDSIQYEPLRRVLKIDDPTFEPVICDPCYERVTKVSLADEWLLPGASNGVTQNNLLKMSR